MINPLELKRDIELVIKESKDKEKLPVPMLAKRAYRAAQEYPNDQPLRVLANVLNKLDKNGRTFISKTEFKNLFKNIATTKNDKVIAIFGHELDIVGDPKERDIAGKPEREFNIYDAVDEKTANMLSTLWGDDGKPSKTASRVNYFDKKTAREAETIVSFELMRIGHEPKKLSIVDGNESYLICEALYETRNGETKVFIPVELTKSGVNFPSTIVIKSGLLDLNAESLKGYLDTFDGKNVVISTRALLNGIDSLKKIGSISAFGLRILAAQEKIDAEERVAELTKRSDYIDNGNSPVFAPKDTFFYNDNYEVKLAETEEVKEFASYLEEPKGKAEMLFGRDAVNDGRNLVANKIRSFGYISQVSVASTCNDSIIYAVGIQSGNGPIGFEVVVDIKNKKPMIPSILAVEDNVLEFTKEGVDKVISSRLSNPTMAAVVSPCYSLKPSEIINTIREAAYNKNYIVAEDALNVLSEKASEETYKKALAEYIDIVGGDGIKKVAKCGCTKIRKSKSYMEPICGHLNLPLSKVAQNERGECIPKYRESMSDTYEGVLFATSKVLLT